MRRFRDLSIRWKLVAMMTLTSLIGLAVLSGALFSIGVGRYRAWAVIEASSLARIIGAECAEAALAKDADTARRELAMLAAGTTVEGACLYSSDGGLLAQYTRAGLPGRPAPTMRSGGETFADGYLELFRPIKLNGQPVGVIYLRINQEYRRERFEAYVIAGIGVAFVSWLISVVLATRLQRIVSRPIQELVRVARAVMEQGDYSLRAAKLSADETALLTDAFNQVLAQAQKRAHDSQVQRVYLEKRVAERTTELKKANEEMRLLQTILLAVGETDDVPSALRVVLSRVCEATGWQVGQAWLLREDGQGLECCAAWHATVLVTPELKAFRKLTEETVSELGSGASGRAWETKKPFWIADVSQHDSFVRGPVAQQAGIRAGVWVPVLAGGHVVALLEFLMFQPGEPEARLVELVTAAAGRVGSLILRKRAENALRRSEERFRLITRATTDGVWDWDLVNNHVWRSESYASLFLYKPEEVGTDNKWFMDRVHPEDRERIMAEFKTARDEGAEFHANEYRFRRADGQYAYVCDRAYFLRDERGVAVRAVGGMVDMTGRRQAEDTLRQSEERYRSLVASSMDAVLLATPEGGILTANEAACQMFGCSAQELTAKGRSGVVDGSDPRVAAALQERDRTGRFRGEVTFVRKDGTKFPGEISSVVFTSGEGQRLINVVIRDITERKRMEEALRRSEQVHRASIEASGAVPYTRDFRANCYEFMGAGIERLIGYAPHECVSGLFENIVEEVVIPGVGTFRTLPEAMRAFSGTGATLWAADYRVRTRDGRECWLTDAAVDERDASGRVVRSVGMLFNITPRKRAEAALKELNETLEQRVAERTALAEARARELAVSEERLREQTRILQSILNSMGDGVVVRDEQMRCLWFNPAFERITGLCPPNLPVEQWQAHYGIFLPDGVTPFPTAQHPMLRALRGEAADNVEMVFRNAAKPQGVVVSVTSRPVRDENGAIRGGVSVLHDITRRKRAEQLLRESEERLRTIVENLNEGVVVATLDGRLTQWNRAALEMHGYTRLEEGQRGLGDFADTFELSGTDGTVWPVEQWPLSRIYRGEHLRDLEVRLRRIHSDWERVFSYGGSLVRDAQGQPLLAVVTVRDITELKRAEETLRESENRYRSLVESATDIIFKVAANGKLVSLNRAFETITGWPCERWIGQLFPPLIHPDDLARAREELDHAVQTGETRLVELRVRSKSGAYLPMEFRGTPYEESGRIAGLLCIARDVTERKRAEEMLRESEARYRNLVESALDVIFTLGADGTVQSLNHAFEQVTGWPCSEWIGRPYAPLFHPHDVSRVTQEVETTLRDRNNPRHIVEARVRTKSGQYLTMEFSGAPYEQGGQVAGLLGIARDITEHKRLEQALLEVSEREQRRIGQDLHDGLCQHLAGVAFMSGVLAQKLTAERQAEADEAKKIAELVRQAAAATRTIAAGLQPVKMEAHGAMDALRELARLTEEMFKVECRFQCDPPVPISDNRKAVHLYRIAQEAVHNAVAHGKAKHIQMTLTARVRRRGGPVTFTVKDDGVGLPEPLPAKRGMGLDIMRHRAQVIGGTLEVRRRAEGGTLLTCSFTPTPPTNSETNHGQE